MASIEAFLASDVYGRQGENLSRELIPSRNLYLSGLSSKLSAAPMVVAVDYDAQEMLKALRSVPLTGSELEDRDDPRVVATLAALVAHRPAPRHPWFSLMDVEGDSNESRHNDFRVTEGLVETKHDGMFGGSRNGRDKRGGDPTYNLCFEFEDGQHRPSGIYRDHDFFSFVLDNRYGEPLLVTYDRTVRLRKFVEAWKRVKGSKFGGNDNSWMTLVWFPYYLSSILPFVED